MAAARWLASDIYVAVTFLLAVAAASTFAALLPGPLSRSPAELAVPERCGHFTARWLVTPAEGEKTTYVLARRRLSTTVWTQGERVEPTRMTTIQPRPRPPGLRDHRPHRRRVDLVEFHSTVAPMGNLVWRNDSFGSKIAALICETPLTKEIKITGISCGGVNVPVEHRFKVIPVPAPYGEVIASGDRHPTKESGSIFFFFFV